MTTPTLSRDQVRQLDRLAVEEYGMTGAMLMENAGRGVADRLCALGIKGPVVICCGPGNNGGDGFVVGRHLDLRGYVCQVLLFADPDKLAGDAALNYRVLEQTDVVITRATPADLEPALKGAAWLVDALLGTGAKGDPRPPIDEVIAKMNASGVPILAIDVPSGLDCDTGKPAGQTIVAQHTCTFVAMKPGFLEPDASRYTGEVSIADIGAPRKLIDEVLVD